MNWTRSLWRRLARLAQAWRRQPKRRFTLVTLTGPSGADTHPNRETLKLYGGFTRLFRLVDIRSYRAGRDQGEVTILDRMALSVTELLEGIPRLSLLARLSGTRRLAFMTSDLHYWSIFPEQADPDMLEGVLKPEDNRNGPLLELFDRLGIEHLVTCYDCPELRSLKRERPALSTYVIDLHVDTSVYRDYGLAKRHDIVVYGNLVPAGYGFRNRVARLLIDCGRFDVLHFAPPAAAFDPQLCGEGLARKINAARLGLATVTDFEYLVGRYFEIPACRTVVLGDMNAQGKRIYRGRYVAIDDAMRDEQIVETVADALGDRARLEGYAAEMHDVIHSEYNLAAYEQKLFDVAEAIGRS